MSQFLVAGLFYGDHPALAERLLGSFRDADRVSEIASFRFGLNEVCAQTETQLLRFALSCGKPCTLYKFSRNVGKYPAMRSMLYGRDCAPAVSWMWFDDDSYLDRPSLAWWGAVADLARHHTLIGSVYTVHAKPQQWAVIQGQPWYQGKPPRTHFRFVTGGWWIAPIALLKRWNYPFPGLYHRAGDSILGELAYQQDWSVHHFREGVRINADAKGRESSAERRGLSCKGTPWIWENGSAAVDPKLADYHYAEIHFAPNCPPPPDGL